MSETTPAEPVYDPTQRVVTLPSGLRIDDQGRILCTAKIKSGKRDCSGPAVAGLKVCRMHGGASPQAKQKAKLRLAELVNPAIATLAREMASPGNRAGDRLSAANSVLDRAGWGRVQRVETADAREMLAQRLMEIRQDETPLAEDTENGD